MGLTRKQKDVFDYIHSYTHKHGVAPTQKEIKEHFALKSFGSVQRYLKYLIDLNLIEQDWNAKRGIKIINPPEQASDQNSPDSLTIALLGEAAAGNPIEAIENPDETISIPLSLVRSPKNLFALRIQGDSMIEKGINNDDIVICRQQNQVENGEIAVCLIDGEATVKTFFHFRDKIELHPANSRLKTMIFEEQEAQRVAVSGKVVALYRQYE